MENAAQPLMDIAYRDMKITWGSSNFLYPFALVCTYLT